MRKKILPDIKGNILCNERLSNHTTFKIGGPCGIWAEPATENDLKKLLTFTRKMRKKILLIGRGSNILVSDKGFNGVVIHLGKKFFKKAYCKEKKIKAGAGIALGRLVSFACKAGLGGLEGMVGIPGTLGGAVMMNAGYRQNISDLLESVRVMDKSTGAIRTLKRENIKFGYRHSNLGKYIILGATLKLKRESAKILSERKKIFAETKKHEQPMESFSAGSVFKNPRNRFPAAKYIDMLNLKGAKIGGAEVSEKHANFIINQKNAKSEDVRKLINFIKRKVKTHFGVDLETEIIII